VHGGFLAGLGLICLYAVGAGLSRRPFLPYVGILLLAALATLANPYGLEYWRYLLEAVTMPRPEITEWLSVFRAFHLGYNRGYILLFFSLVLFLFFLALWERWRDLTAILALSLTLYLGLKHLRHQAFFLILAGAYLPVLLTSFIQAIKTDTRILAISRRLGWKIPVFIGLIVIFFNGFMAIKQGPLSLEIPDRPGQAAATSVYYPVQAVAYIQEHHLSGALLTNFYWGEYLIWRLSPQVKVSLDGRYETVYSKQVCQEYFDFLYGRAPWRQFLQKYPPDLVLLDSRTRVCALLRSEPDWQQVYLDSGCALFVRRARAAIPASPERAAPATIWRP
jgi:hypothetical protein